MAGTWADIGKEFRRASAIQRIVRSVAWELLSDPKPLDLDRVPPSPQALTPAYLTKILCAGHPDAQVNLDQRWAPRPPARETAVPSA